MTCGKTVVAVAVVAATLVWLPAPSAAAVFVYHLNAPADLLDPAKCNNQRCRRVMWPIYEPLIDLSKDSRTLVPALAESWEVSRDGLTYTFRLRRGVRFHDGAEFTAAAAKLNLERNFLKGKPFYTETPRNVREELLAGLIRDITVQNDHTLVVGLKHPQVHILFLIPMVSPEALAKYGKDIGAHPVGTGPFKFLRRTSDEVRLVANKDYWSGPPKLGEISFRVIPDSEKAMRSFLSGGVDFLPEVEPLYLERIIANQTAKLVRVPTLSTYYLGFRVDRRPFDDARVRKAVTSALDVDRAVLFTSRGMAVPAYGPIPPGVGGHDPELKRSPSDPAASRRLLQEAGATQLQVALHFNAGWGFFAELAQAIKADLMKVGIKVDLVPSPGYPELVSEIRQGKGDLFIYNWFTILPDADVWLPPLFKTKSVDNLTGYANPAVDELLDRARLLMDPAARVALYKTAQRMIVNDAPMVFLFHEVRVSAFNTRVSGIDLNVQSFPVDRFSRIEIRSD